MTLAGPSAMAELTFAIPADWFAIRLPRDQVDAEELAAELAARLPDTAGSSETLRGLVGNLVDACAALDVLCGYATVLSVPGGPLPASMVVSTWSAGGKAVAEIRDQLAAAGGPLAPPPALLNLPVGPAARIERLREWGGQADGRHPVSLIVQYVTPVPGTSQVLLLTFSTPALALAARLRPLFHGIACTLRFGGAEPER